MKVQLAVFVLLIVTLALTCSSAQDYTIDNFRCQNFITGLDYKDGTLVIGTRLGLHVFRNGELRTLTVQNGLPTNYIPYVAVSDADSIYIGPCRLSYEDERRYIYLIHLLESGLEVKDITGDFIPPGSYYPFAAGPDGSLWVDEPGAMWQYSMDEWKVYHAEEAEYGFGDICFTREGGAYACSRGVVYKASGDRMIPLPTPFPAYQLATGPEGNIWSTGDGHLWRYGLSGWEIASSDPFWSENLNGMFFDGLNQIWAIVHDNLDVRIARYREGEVSFYDEADGLWFNASLIYWPLFEFSGSTLIPPETPVFGTAGLGLIYFDGERFRRFYWADSPPGDIISDLIEDDQGQLWVINGKTRMLGVYDGEHWNQVYAPWYLPWDAPGVFRLFPLVALDLDGSLWFRSETGAVSYSQLGWTFYDGDNSPLVSPGTVAIDDNGTKWFVNPALGADIWEPISGVVSFDGATWGQFPSDEYFESWEPISVCVGPGNKMWFRRRSATDYLPYRYTAFDGTTWEHFVPGRDLPDEQSSGIHFDINGNALLAGWNSLYRQNETGAWEVILNESVGDVQADSNGTLYCAAYDYLYVGDKYDWQTLTIKYDPTDPNSDLTVAPNRVFIDHDGDKWVGAYGGLNRLRDGGPAAQKLTLAAIVAQSQGGAGETLLLSGEFINTYTTMPVSLWLACELDGTFYFYPDWGTTMQCVDIVLPAHSIERRELFTFDADLLPAGTYTFIGGISLRGGAHLMIGARDDKYSFATWTND